VVQRVVDDATSLIESFKAQGMKITPQRRLLCTLVAEAHDHPTVETIYHRAIKSMPTISLKTVYTTLTELSDIGAIKLTTLGAGSLRVDRNVAPHAHLVCNGCGRVVDRPMEIDKHASAVDETGFEIEEQILVFRGRCALCR